MSAQSPTISHPLLSAHNSTEAVGVILRAKRAGLVPACRPLLDSLTREGFFLADALYLEALRLAEEVAAP